MDSNAGNINAGRVSGSGFDYERFAREELARRSRGTELSGALEIPGDGEKSPVDEAGKDGGEKKKKGSELFDWVQCLVSALLFCVLTFTFFVRIIGVVGDSMVPTFHNGDRVVTSNLFYEPSQGDVIVLRKETFKEEPIIKRVIATEGQTVDIDFQTGTVYVDDVAIDEPYIAELTRTSQDFTGKITVPENSVFVMGDNRNNSTDSRTELIGCVDERHIIGRVLIRILPLRDFGPVE